MSKPKPQVIEDQEHQRVFERVAAIDVAKASGMVCVRLPGRDGRPRASKVWEVPAVTSAVTELAGACSATGSRWSRWRRPATTCEVRVHEFKWEALLEARLRPVVQYPGQCAMACLRPGVRRG